MGIIYFGIGFYLAQTILSNDHSCGAHEGSFPNTWSAKKDDQDYENVKRVALRKNFDESLYHLDKWEDVYFSSRDNKIKINVTTISRIFFQKILYKTIIIL